MPRLKLDAWAIDKARREDRIEAKTCPMCGEAKRSADVYCSDECKKTDQRGDASNE